MNPALLLLLGLRVKAVLARTRRLMAKPAHAVATAAGAGLLVLMILPGILAGAGRGMEIPPEYLRHGMPPALLLFFLATLLGARRLLLLTPPEIVFLLAGPFSHRQITACKMIAGASGSMLSAMLIAIWMRWLAGGWLKTWLAVGLVMVFLYLLGLVVVLLWRTAKNGLRPRVFRAGAILLAGLILAGITHTITTFPFSELLHAFESENPVSALRAINALPAVAVATLPFQLFGMAFAGMHQGVFGPWMGALVVYNLLLAGLGLALPARFDDKTVRESYKSDQKLERVKAGDWGAAGPFVLTRVRLPDFPHWGGMGAIAWRQSLNGLQRLPGLLFIVALVAAPGMLTGFSDIGEGALVVLLPSLLIVTMIGAGRGFGCDFRSDIQHIDQLKSLPVRPGLIALGEVLPSVFLLLIAQSIPLAAAFYFAPDLWFVPLGAFLLLIPVNLLVIGVENLAFLLFPVRQKSAATDPLAMLRLMLTGVVKLLCAALILGGAFGCGFAAYWFLGGSWTAGLITGGLVLAAAASTVMAGVAAAFNSFDPTVVAEN